MPEPGPATLGPALISPATAPPTVVPEPATRVPETQAPPAVWRGVLRPGVLIWGALAIAALASGAVWLWRQRLESKYRDGLRRNASSTSVDLEGDVVWTQEYLRYRLGRCSHGQAVDRVLG